jgi:hypothetical protein
VINNRTNNINNAKLPRLPNGNLRVIETLCKNSFENSLQTKSFGFSLFGQRYTKICEIAFVLQLFPDDVELRKALTCQLKVMRKADKKLLNKKYCSKK